LFAVNEEREEIAPPLDPALLPEKVQLFAVNEEEE
jgi:hypothetical protein